MSSFVIDKWGKEIQNYCEQNNLDFEKVVHMPKSWGENFFAILFHDKEKGRQGLLDETPMPIVLMAHIRDGVPIFEQTEYTQKYIGK
ncbi:MAG: hypothetical protein LUG85_08335 [Clostridiales bacterium]|nr:hypothetical protein [Clostridiales bacterium]